MSDANRHRLTQWIDDESGLSRSAIAAELLSSRQSLYRYENGSMPRQPTLDRLVILTGGAVTANDWLGKEAAALVAERRADA